MGFSVDNDMCRTCLTSTGNLVSIFDVQSSKTSSLVDIIKIITSIQVSSTDGLPGKICLSCVSDVNRAYSFRIKCENSDLILRKYLNEQMQNKDKENGTHNNYKIMPIFEEEEEDNIDHIVNDEIISDDLNVNIEGIPEFSKQESIVNYVKHELCNEYENTDNVTIYVSGDNFEDHNGSNCSEIQQQHEPEQQEQQEQEQQEQQQLEQEQQQQQEQKDPVVESIGDIDMDIDESLNENYRSYSDREDATVILYCADCNETFDNVQSFEMHAKSCRNDNDENKRKSRKKRNNNNKRDKAPIKCPYCPVDFVHKKNLDKHVNKYHTKKSMKNEKKLDDNDCKNYDDNEKNQQNSSNSECIIEKIDVVDLKHNQQFLNTPFKCFNCSAGFVNEKSLSFHIKLNKCTEEQYSCISCKKVFINKKNLIQHMKTHTTFQCSICSKVFSDQKELNSHIDIEHSKNKKNQCQFCNKVFTMLSSLKDHLRTHSGEKPFLCSLCGKAFTQSTNLKQHIMRHTKTKPYKCSQCDKSFVSKGELNSHLRKHTGDHPFVCNTCGSNFTTSSSLAKHVRSHTGERPYACEYCPMRFSALGILKNHRRTHTGEKPFACRICDRSFAQRSDCVSHSRTHTGERPYVCAECGTGFLQSGSLRGHMKSVHNMIYKKIENVKKK